MCVTVFAEVFKWSLMQLFWTVFIPEAVIRLPLFCLWSTVILTALSLLWGSPRLVRTHLHTEAQIVNKVSFTAISALSHFSYSKVFGTVSNIKVAHSLCIKNRNCLQSWIWTELGDHREELSVDGVTLYLIENNRSFIKHEHVSFL